ncbi:HNH endonuclease [Dapis sp. BLCC M229]|uniref:HNH endonuclease n=1 Tax=Dapis sp. BLCC M229 TaxID=3400188 RepID=UPI003CEC7334
MMKKPQNWSSLISLSRECECPHAYIVGYYLSRFDKKAYQNLGLGNKNETHKKIGIILSFSGNTIKNIRDSFDPYHNNPRKGWWQRDLWRFEKEIYEGLKNYSEGEINYLVCWILENPKQSFEELFDNINLSDYQNKVLFPNEVQESIISDKFPEGSVYKVNVNAYERNSKARKICIEYYGSSCYVCGFNFEKVFGEIGRDFIHVHHLIPLSDIDRQYEVDPIKDLRPLCPNCHAMIHKKSPPFSIEELKKIISLKNPEAF